MVDSCIMGSDSANVVHLHFVLYTQRQIHIHSACGGHDVHLQSFTAVTQYSPVATHFTDLGRIAACVHGQST